MIRDNSVSKIKINIKNYALFLFLRESIKFLIKKTIAKTDVVIIEITHK